MSGFIKQVSDALVHSYNFLSLVLKNTEHLGQQSFSEESDHASSQFPTSSGN